MRLSIASSTTAFARNSINWFGTGSKASITSIEVTTFLDTTIEELIENFEFLGDWEERFAYLIELGKKLPPLDETEITDEHRVHGCRASVWLRILPQTDGTFDIHADSDAFIVKGLIAIASIYSGKMPSRFWTPLARERSRSLDSTNTSAPRAATAFTPWSVA